MLRNLEILQVYSDSASIPGKKALRFAACIAKSFGAALYASGKLPQGLENSFYEAEDVQVVGVEPSEWAKSAPDETLRVILTTGAPGEPATNAPHINISLERWQTEETLFASSGIAHLLGDPDKAPLVPAANYAAHTIGYAAFAAIVSIALKYSRFGEKDSATINGAGVLAWVNWKSAIHASLGGESKRKGDQAEWPILDCEDGHTAFVFNERDWASIVEMIDEPALRADEFSTFEGRQANRDGYMKHVRAWFEKHSKAFLSETMVKHAIPGAPAYTVSDLFSDPLLLHRDAFEKKPNGTKVPKLPHRVAEEIQSELGPVIDPPANKLPLSGLRVLDFGIITAGAGVSALLADMGAEVLKIEAPNRADPFRIWPGAPNSDDPDSPVFKSNNRNKLGIALDLKTEAGKREFFDLAKSADIVLENYRRGVLDRLGITFDALREANPRILLASISGQGLDGPGAEHTTFGSTLEASSGFASLTCYEDGVPVISGRNLNYPDQIVCLYGAATVAAYAVDCRRHGLARHIDISQRDCAVYQLGDALAEVSNSADDNADTVRRLCGRPTLSAMFKCATNQYVALSAEHPDLVKEIDGLDSLDLLAVGKWAENLSADKAVEAFIAAGGGGVVSGNGFTILEDQSLFESDIFAHSPNGALVKGFPFQLSGSPMKIFSNSPKVGEHTDEVFSLMRAIDSAASG